MSLQNSCNALTSVLDKLYRALKNLNLFIPSLDFILERVFAKRMEKRAKKNKSNTNSIKIPNTHRFLFRISNYYMRPTSDNLKLFV